MHVDKQSELGCNTSKFLLFSHPNKQYMTIYEKEKVSHALHGNWSRQQYCNIDGKNHESRLQCSHFFNLTCNKLWYVYCVLTPRILERNQSRFHFFGTFSFYTFFWVVVYMIFNFFWFFCFNVFLLIFYSFEDFFGGRSRL